MDFLHTATTRRKVLQALGVGSAGVSSALSSLVHAAGSDAPEKKEVKIGFIPLTDCASIVMASVLGLIPAVIAYRKGRSFGLWWIYGSMLFIVALFCLVMVAQWVGRRFGMQEA